MKTLLALMFCSLSALAQIPPAPLQWMQMAAMHKPASGGSYNPASDPSVVEWLRASVSTAANNTTTNHWPALIGTDMYSSSQGPVYVANAGSSRPAFKFNALGAATTNATFGTIAQPFTIWINCQFVNASNFNFAFDGITSTNRAVLLLDFSLPYYYPYYQLFSTSSIDSASVCDYGWHVIECVFNGASTYCKLDNTTIISGNLGSSAITGLTLASQYTFLHPADVLISDIIVQNTTPSNEAGTYTYLSGILP